MRPAATHSALAYEHANNVVTSAVDDLQPLSFATRATVAAIRYLALLTESDAFGKYTLRVCSPSSHMRLGPTVIKALQLIPSVRGATAASVTPAFVLPMLCVTRMQHDAGGGSQHSTHRTLLGLLGRCSTKMGFRTLRRWIRQPLTNLSRISARHDIVQVGCDAFPSPAPLFPVWWRVCVMFMCTLLCAVMLFFLGGGGGGGGTDPTRRQ